MAPKVGFQKALDSSQYFVGPLAPPDPNSTMSGMQLNAGGGPAAPPSATPAPSVAGATDQFNNDMKDWHNKANDMINNWQGVDVAGKYKELMSQVQNRPTDQMPNPLASMAFALGSPKAGEANLKDRFDSITREKIQKEHDLMDLKGQIIHGQIMQEMEKGNFKRALDLTEQTAQLDKIKETYKSALDLAAKKDLSNQGFEQKEKLQREKGEQAEALLSAKIAGNESLRKWLEAHKEEHDTYITLAKAAVKPGQYGQTSPEIDPYAEMVARNYLSNLEQRANQEAAGNKPTSKPSTTVKKPADPLNILK